MKKTILLFTLLAFIQSVRGQDFIYHFVTDEYEADRVLFADFDNDGDTDIFGIDRIYQSPNKLVYFEYDDTDSLFGMKVSYINSSIEADGVPATGDFDGDGDMDVAVSVGFDNPELYVYTNDGTGTFTAVSTGIKDVVKLQAIDIDGDGDMDLTGGKSTVVSFFGNDGTGAFSLLGSYDTGIDYFSYYVADFNSDGEVDFLIRYKESGKYKLRLFKNTGTFQFEGLPVYEQDKKINLVRLKDFDLDGDLDIVFDDEDFVTCMINDGDFLFSTKTVLEAEGFFDSFDDFDLGDIDNDGDIDVIVGDERNGLFWYKNSGSPALDQFEKVQIWDQKPNYDIALQDFNNDNKLDIYTTGLYATGILENALKLNTNTLKNDQGILLYPNPTSGVLHFDEIGNCKVSILDLLGKVRDVKMINNSYIDISSLNAGIYFIKLETGKGIFTNRVIKK